MSRVDVIVPCYNYGRFLRGCVESVLSQAGPRVRVLIIDDASPDNSVEVAADLVKGDARVTLLRHSTNRGHIVTYNEGLDWVSAKYLLLLSADDYLLPGALDRATALMNTHPQVGFTYGGAIMLDSESGETRLGEELPCRNAYRILEGSEFIACSGGSNIVFSPTAVVRTEFQKMVGGYREDLPHCADMELWLRLAAHGAVGYIKTPQAVYRRHGDNMSLPYMDRWLPDLKQRDAALNCFFSAYGHMIPNAVQLRQRATYQLSCAAVAYASDAFEDGELNASRELVTFVQRACPDATRSLQWAKFALKRTVGVRMFRTLRSLIRRIKPAPKQGNF
jgi:GT2 family glycosyltransferase